MFNHFQTVVGLVKIHTCTVCTYYGRVLQYVTTRTFWKMYMYVMWRSGFRKWRLNFWMYVKLHVCVPHVCMYVWTMYVCMNVYVLHCKIAPVLYFYCYCLILWYCLFSFSLFCFCFCSCSHSRSRSHFLFPSHPRFHFNVLNASWHWQLKLVGQFTMHSFTFCYTLHIPTFLSVISIFNIHNIIDMIGFMLSVYVVAILASRNVKEDFIAAWLTFYLSDTTSNTRRGCSCFNKGLQIFHAGQIVY